VEFKILQGFIMNIEDESMRGYEFDDKLRNYYNVYESIYRIFPFMISTN